MRASDLDPAIAATLVDRQLLEHPFYQRWERGEVSLGELGSYAAQYRYFERYLPGFLHQLVGELPPGPAHDLVAANLADEQGDPVPHVELFERFAEGVGAGDEGASPAISHLLGVYDELLVEAPVAALAGFMAYESQASDVARRKADGLRDHHGLDDQAVSFWEHHATVDALHGVWARQALEASSAAPGDLVPFVRRAADAWWAFLDEREALAPAS
jgi:pyrroloquinoline-quinone synthase